MLVKRYSTSSNSPQRSAILRRSLLLAPLLVSFPSAMVAQTISGVTGTVTDDTGAVISGASVSLKNNATGTVANTVTTSAGQYTEEGLQPGRYTVTVAAPGFQKSIKNEVNVEVTVRSTIDFKLQPGNSN